MNYDENLLTTKQLAELIHCCPKTIKRYRDTGRLHGFKSGKTYLYTREEVARFLGQDIADIFPSKSDNSE